MIQQKITAIVVSSENQVNKFRKYRNIVNQDEAIKKFISFCSKIPGVDHINFYKKEGGKIYFRHNFNTKRVVIK